MRDQLRSLALASLLALGLGPLGAQAGQGGAGATPNPPSSGPASAAAPSAAVQVQAPGARDLSLEEALGRADEAPASVRAAASQLESAQKKVWVATTALLPSITASATGAWLANPPTGMTVKAGSLGTLPLWVPATANPGTSYSGAFVPYPVSLPGQDWAIVPDAKSTYFKGNLTLTQPLLTWGKLDAGLELARLEAEVAALGLSGARQDAERETRRAYDAALLARDSGAILAELRDLAAANAADAEAALSAGTTTRAKVLEAEARLAELDARLVDVREGESSALEGLALLLGLGEARPRLSSELPGAVPPLDETKLLAAARAASAERGRAELRLSEAARKVQLERGSSALLPDLAAFASLDASGQTIPFSSADWADSTWSWDLSLGIQAQLKVFDGGAALARVAAAKADLSAARIGVEGSDDQLRLALRDAVAAVRRAQAQSAAKLAGARSAAETLRSAKASYDAGLLGRPDYNGAAMQEAGARLDLLSARYALAESLAELLRLVGGRLP